MMRSRRANPRRLDRGGSSLKSKSPGALRLGAAAARGALSVSPSGAPDGAEPNGLRLRLRSGSGVRWTAVSPSGIVVFSTLVDFVCFHLHVVL